MDAPTAASKTSAPNPSGWRGWLLRIDRLVCWLGRLSIVLSLAVVLIFCFCQVLDRYALKSQFDAWDQIARIGMLWSAFLGAALALRERRNVVIDLIDSRLPKLVRQIRNKLFDVILLALSIILLVKGLDVVEVGKFQDIVGTPFTYAVSYTALTASMVLFIFFLILRLIMPNAPVPLDVFHPAEESDHDTLGDRT